jgi:glucoamylase
VTRIAVLATALLLLLCAEALGDRPAPGAPGERHTWTAADKHGFGTATEPGSRAWFTLRSAELTEIYYPDLGTPSFRQLEFAVTDGRGFIDRETDEDVSSEVTAIPGSLAFKQVTRTSRWRLTKVWVTDPARDAVLAKVRFEPLTRRKLRLYLLVDPAPGDDGNDDRGSERRRGLAAWDDTVASVVAADPKLDEHTSGYAGTASDPWVDLRRDFELDRSYEAREPGNVVQAARVDLDGKRGRDDITLAIGFGPEAESASHTARAALEAGFWSAARSYGRGWAEYLGSVKEPPGSVRRSTFLRRVYDQSVMVLEASEDKANRGASIASPTMPWVWGTLTLAGTENSGPYHLVWPRDLYHVATAQQALGDEAAAIRLLEYLWRVKKPDGSWWQNTEVTGEPHWTSTQLDEVSLPIVLAWWLGRTSASDWQHVRAAADYVVDNGPYTPQERWENQDGWSPNTIATEIAGLVCAADIARRNGDEARAERYEETADAWERRVEEWTATDSTEYYSPAPYYVRVTKDADPNDGSDYNLGDNFPRPVDEREIVDQSFLGLVLFGVKPHDDPAVLNSLKVGDEVLKVGTPNGPVWYRFTHDGYGETATGGDWGIFPTAERQTFGRLWPLLAGERGEYELLAGRDAGSYLWTIARTANDGLMLPEQVWDGRPPTGRRGHDFGEGTRSATPLGWTHAQLIRLAWSIDAGHPIERPSIVAERYASR